MVDVEPAFRNGADYIVIGRSMTQAADPLTKARAIQETIARYLGAQ